MEGLRAEGGVGTQKCSKDSTFSRHYKLNSLGNCGLDICSSYCIVRAAQLTFFIAYLCTAGLEVVCLAGCSRLSSDGLKAFLAASLVKASLKYGARHFSSASCSITPEPALRPEQLAPLLSPYLSPRQVEC